MFFEKHVSAETHPAFSYKSALFTLATWRNHDMRIKLHNDIRDRTQFSSAYASLPLSGLGRDHRGQTAGILSVARPGSPAEISLPFLVALPFPSSQACRPSFFPYISFYYLNRAKTTYSEAISTSTSALYWYFFYYCYYYCFFLYSFPFILFSYYFG